MHRPTRTLLLRACTGIAGLLGAAGAQAQFDHQLYGIADLSYGRFEPSGQIADKRFNSNSLSPSFAGLNLKYGLDGGWTPGITLEAFVRFQTLQLGRSDSDPLLSRNNFASLNGPYGLVRVGRLQTYLFDATSRFNAFGNSVSFSPAVRHVFASGNLESVQQDFYWNRAVSYSTPTIEGVTLSLMRSMLGSDESGARTGGSLVVSYGLFALGLAGQRIKVDDRINAPTSETTWQLGLSYNVGIARLFGLYTKTRDAGQEVDSKSSSAGVTLALGPGDLLAQIGYTTAKGPAVDRKHTSTSLGYIYPYDSQIDIYLLGMDDRIRDQTRGLSAAVGVRWRF